MYLSLHATSASLADAWNFRGLFVSAKPGAAIPESLTDAMFLDGEHVWISVDYLRNQGSATNEWRSQFDAMIAYAGSKGWLSDDRSRVRAHLEPPAKTAGISE